MNICKEYAYIKPTNMSEYYTFACTIIEECAKIAEDADMLRVPASEYASLIREFKRLEM